MTQQAVQQLHSRKKLDVMKIKSMYTITEGEHSGALRSVLEKGKAIIAELYRFNPFTMQHLPIEDLVATAKSLEAAGAQALCVATDFRYKATAKDLSSVKAAVSIPVIQRDYIIDPIQIAEAKAHGADGVILIEEFAEESLEDLLEACETIGVEPIIEVCSQPSLERALRTKCKTIIVSNRDPLTGNVDPAGALRMYPFVPRDRSTIVYSALTIPRVAHYYLDHGVAACISGDPFLFSENKKWFIQLAAAPLVKLKSIGARKTAGLAAEAGCDLIGIECYEGAEQFVGPDGVKALAKEIQAGGAEPVCIFNEQKGEEMLAILAASNVRIAQFLDTKSSKEHTKLPKEVIRVFHIAVAENGNPKRKLPEEANPYRDYVVYECPSTEAAKKLIKSLANQQPFPYFLSGTLPLELTDEERSSLCGFEIGDTVFNSRGNLDIFLLKEAISQAKRA